MGKLMIIGGAILFLLGAAMLLSSEMFGVSLIHKITGMRGRIPYLYEIQMGLAVGGIGLIGAGVLKNRADSE
jgi:hypothetical protein